MGKADGGSRGRDGRPPHAGRVSLGCRCVVHVHTCVRTRWPPNETRISPTPCRCPCQARIGQRSAPGLGRPPSAAPSRAAGATRPRGLVARCSSSGSGGAGAHSQRRSGEQAANHQVSLRAATRGTAPGPLRARPPGVSPPSCPMRVPQTPGRRRCERRSRGHWAQTRLGKTWQLCWPSLKLTSQG
jgi:hypothetical protein